MPHVHDSSAGFPVFPQGMCVKCIKIHNSLYTLCKFNVCPVIQEIQICIFPQSLGDFSTF